ncbi:MAG: hypothetical protein KF878_10835 [Planctomycetes bacterium]|nr:hypothetical protein [Planctomycetota bacterium]
MTLLRRWCSSPEGVRDWPAFYGLAGLLCVAYGGHGVLRGAIHVGRSSSGGLVHRASDPGFFWFVTLSLCALGAGLVTYAWRRARAAP